MGELCRCGGQARGLICAAVVREYLGVSVLGSHAHAENETDAAGSWTFPSDRTSILAPALLVSCSMLGRIILKY
jgi:hypothetical protein